MTGSGGREPARSPFSQWVVAVLVSASVLVLPACGAEQQTPPPQPRVERPTFEGSRAYELVRTQVEFGPRVPGTQGHADQLAWMISTLTPLADSLEVEQFSYETTGGEVLELSNVLARFNLAASQRLLLLAHWDTRPTADQEADSTARGVPIPGANDGASGVAVLMTLAEMLSEQAPPIGVDLLFVDGEDYGPSTDDMFIGARHYADAIQNATESAPMYAVLLDMVGDADPLFPIEGYSSQYALALAQRVWGVARDLGYAQYFPTRVGQFLQDDHVPLNEAGLATIDIIDFEYGPDHSYWHTAQDRMENVSPRTLGMVGEVIAELVYRGG